jgi:class 3 adenylate cyclase
LGTWGTGAELDLIAPTVAADDNFRRWYAQVQRMSASPATAVAMARQWYEVDVRSVLPAIRVPTLVLARAANVIFPVQHTRYLAEHIAGAKYIEFPGADLFYFTGDADQVLDAIEEFVTGMRPLPSPDRFLGTVLFVDVVGSTQLAAEIGDSRFRELIDGFVQLVQRQLDRYQGRLVDTAGDGALALFDSPARAIACAEAVRDGVRALGVQVRAGVHTGEMEHGPGGEIRGIAVHTGARVAALAGPGEILVSRTIRDLVAGTPSGWKAAVSTSSRACPAPGRSSQLPAENPTQHERQRPARPSNSTTKLTQAAHPASPRNWPPHNRAIGAAFAELAAALTAQPNRQGAYTPDLSESSGLRV